MIWATVNSQLEAAGFAHYGVTPLGRPFSMDIYRAWLKEGRQASMKYLADHAAAKEDSRTWAPRAKTAIVVAQPYFPHPRPSENSSLRTALYAQGEDYHFWFKERLEVLARKWRSDFLGEEFLCFTDSAPILERDLAYRAGLGWVGKNTCLIHPEKGSLFFLGQILTSVEFNEKVPTVKDYCGSCDKCLRACPTQALVEPRKLDANKCIAYWTIEAQGNAPPEIRSRLGDWFFGCDICQTVCPWNEKHHGRDLMRALSAEQAPPLAEDLRWILESSNKALARAFAASPLSRARPRGLKRNALRLVGTHKLNELRTQVERQLDDPYLGEIARWALEQLS